MEHLSVRDGRRAAEVSLELHRDSVEVIWPKLGRGHEVRFLQDKVSDTLTLVARAAQASFDKNCPLPRS